MLKTYLKIAFRNLRNNNIYSFINIAGLAIGMAIFISCLGLLGLSTFLTRQKTKEIGIRKVLGASVTEIVKLLSNEFTKWVLIANLIVWLITWFAMTRWLQNFAYKVEIGWWVFLLAGGIALITALITICPQATRAAIANPVNAIKYE